MRTRAARPGTVEAEIDRLLEHERELASKIVGACEQSASPINDSS